MKVAQKENPLWHAMHLCVHSGVERLLRALL
jgi:hypothetical protein